MNGKGIIGIFWICLGFLVSAEVHRPDAEGFISDWLICEHPDEPTLRWSALRKIAPGFLCCQPTVLSDAPLVRLPFSSRENRTVASDVSIAGRICLHRFIFFISSPFFF